MEAGLFVNGNNQSLQTQQQMMMMMPSPPLLTVATGSVTPSSPLNGLNQSSRYVSMDDSRSLAILMEKQSLEIDNYVRLQSNSLRAVLQEKTKHHVTSLLTTLEWKASTLIRAKDEELANVKQRKMELEDCIKTAVQERDAWLKVAKEYEAMALSLTHTLEQVREPCFSTTGQDEVEAAEAGIGRGLCLPCRSCGSRESCVLLLPCLHLCACQPCEALLEACPVCRSVKRGSTEVFLA